MFFYNATHALLKSFLTILILGIR